MGYLTSIAGGRKKKSSATAIVDIKSYYRFTTPSAAKEKNYYDYLLNLQYLKAYVDYLQQDCALAPTTIAAKIRRLRLAMEYTLFAENPTETQHHTVYKNAANHDASCKVG